MQYGQCRDVRHGMILRLASNFLLLPSGKVSQMAALTERPKEWHIHMTTSHTAYQQKMMFLPTKAGFNASWVPIYLLKDQLSVHLHNNSITTFSHFEGSITSLFSQIKSPGCTCNPTISPSCWLLSFICFRRGGSNS
jgi:hypothetical protein